ncbi:MAG TPA: nuclear transport factor 2 family protein [Gemmatimonadales bacterium]|jgi:ketosteroid isomerase-like protein|nr:nuclear transport factor 2 family protein [Gemmatimonadales bacterium]
MSRALGIVAILGLVAAGCHRTPAYITPADRASLHATQDTLAARMQRGDFDGVAARYGAQAKMMAPNQPMIVGRTAIEASLRADPRFTTFALTVDTVFGMGDLAVLRGHYRLSFTLPGSSQAVADSGKYLQVQWRQPDGGWLTQDEIYNSDIPAPMPPAPAPKRSK